MTDQTNREAWRGAYARDFSGIDMDFDQHVEVVIGYKAGWQAALKHAQQAVEIERDKVLEQRVDDLAALVGRLVRALNKAAPDNDLPAKAMDYLKRHNLQGSPLRCQQPAQADRPDIESTASTAPKPDTP